MHVVSEQLNPLSPDENRHDGAEEKVDETAISVSSTEKSLVRNYFWVLTVFEVIEPVLCN